MSPPSHNSSAPKIMVFRPTLEEMKDFPAYISYMESKGAHKAGIAKIIPPKDFVAAYDYEKAESMMIPAPIQQEVMGHQGLYTQYNIQKKPLTFPEFRKLANSSRYATPPHFDYDDLERKYWKNITYNPPIYAADISGSLYSKGCDIWNINKLNTLLDVIEEEQGVKIEGVNTAYLYFGMWKTTFAWHTEDMDLYSINYLHFGAPKSWYGIPPEHAKRLERLAAGFFPQSFQICPNFLRHKMTLISPQILKKYSIPYDKITQETGEFMITFPYGYHAGYNHGYNCAESTNFASLRWIDFGKRAKCCSCQRDSVKINMDPFIRIFQPHRYDAWKQGKDIVYIEDIDKPSSGIQSQNMLETQSPRKSKDNEVVPVKTRRQPLHKKDGRRVKTDTTGHRKRNHKGNLQDEDSKTQAAASLQQVAPTVTIPVVKMEVEHLETTSVVAHSDVQETASSPAQVAQADSLLSQEEPALKVRCLEASSLPSPDTSENSTQKIKKKKSKSDKCDSKSKKKHKHPNREESRTESSDSETKRVHSKSKKKHSKSKSKESSKVKREKKVNVVDSDREVGDLKQYQSGKQPQHSISDSNSGSIPQSKDDVCHNGVKGVPGKIKEKSPKTGLLLEKEQAKMRRKIKNRKAALVKWKDGVKREHAYSSNPGHSSGPTHHKKKVKHKKIKLDKMFEKSVKKKPNHTTKERPEKSSPDVISAEVTHQEDAKKEVAVKNPVRKKDQSKPKDSVSKTKAPAEKAAPKGKTKHDFTSQEFAVMKAWARSMNGLWVTQPHSYDMELAYNLSMADQRPGCCVCMLFYNEKIDGKDWDSNNLALQTAAGNAAGASIDQRTQVLTPEMCFAATSENRFPECMNEALTAEGRSVILNCSQCKIAVHASCYGVSGESSETWKCRRCEEQDYLAECCLCNLRGGALKRTTNGRWAHIVCAMAIPEVIFEDVQAREPINIDKISPARLKLKCFFCRPFIKMMNKFGGLIQCSVGRCALAFHVTCAQAAGVVMEPCDWPFAVYATCLRHPYPDKTRDNLRDYPLKDVCLGETVIAKHKNSRYYKAEATEERQQAFYHVKFDDGSYSENLYPHDIESHDCTNHGPPPQGTAVTVRWTDGLPYKGTFVSSYMVKMYDVEFEDGSVSRVKREDIYRQDEPLPKKVITKLSTASDMRHVNFWDNKVVTERHRHVYSLYASSQGSPSGSEADDKTLGSVECKVTNGAASMPSRQESNSAPDKQDDSNWVNLQPVGVKQEQGNPEGVSQQPVGVKQELEGFEGVNQQPGGIQQELGDPERVSQQPVGVRQELEGLEGVNQQPGGIQEELGDPERVRQQPVGVRQELEGLEGVNLQPGGIQQELGDPERVSQQPVGVRQELEGLEGVNQQPGGIQQEPGDPERVSQQPVGVKQELGECLNDGRTSEDSSL